MKRESRRATHEFRRMLLPLAGILVVSFACPTEALPQDSGRAIPASGLLTSRDDLLAAEAALTDNRGDTQRATNAETLAAIRQRLNDGDFQVGDRVVVTVVSNMSRTDTLVVRSGRVLEIPGDIRVPLSGVLRSELRDRVKTEVLKYVKAQEVEVTPLLRLGVLGSVIRGGYFSVASDISLSDAIMAAGGPSSEADLARSVVRRAGREFRTASETREAINRGLTPDQFGLMAGDEIIIGTKRQLISTTLATGVGLVASVVTLLIATQR